jgi:hypothetical protein
MSDFWCITRGNHEFALTGGSGHARGTGQGICPRTAREADGMAKHGTWLTMRTSVVIHLQYHRLKRIRFAVR